MVGGAEECTVAAGAGAGAGMGAGASVGAAWVTRSIVTEPKWRDARDVIGMMTAKATYLGRERRGIVSTV